MKKIRKLAAVLVALTLLTGCSATTVKVPPIKVPSPIPSGECGSNACASRGR